MHCDFPRTTGGGRSPDFKTMRACVLHDVRALAVRNVPTPQLGPRDVLLRVAAVGLCGTDLHIYQGEANYNMDERGQPVPLTRPCCSWPRLGICAGRSEEHTSELQSRLHLVCRLLLE